jgi:hypothetical protein
MELSLVIVTRSIVKAIAIAVAVAFFALVSLLMLMPSDRVEERYTSIGAAREAQLFQRGWLPDILPMSTNRLRVSSYADSNTADGEFYFDAVEWHSLRNRLSGGISKQAPYVRWSSDVESYTRNGYDAWSTASDDMNWVFFCKPAIGHCEYVAWPKRDG